MGSPDYSIRSVFVGFAGLLLLMGCLAVDSAWQTRNVSATAAMLRKDARDRDTLLDQLSNDVYRSATLTRDYLLERDEGPAASQKEELRSLRSHVEQSLSRYAKTAPQEQKDAVRSLQEHTSAYWTSLAPALEWTRTVRSQQGEVFLRNIIIPRRNEVVQLVKQINALDETALDAGEERIQDVQARFQRRVRVFSVLGLVLGMILTAIVIRHLQHLSRKARSSFEEVLAARENLRRLSKRLVKVQEDERRVLSRELHDELGQTMSAILLEVGKLEAAASERGRHPDGLTSLRKLAEENIAKVRNMALLLRPGMLDELGLAPALRWQAREVTRGTGVKVRMIADEIDDDLPEAVRTCIYRVVQEALNNCVKHAVAKEVRVALQRDAEGLAVSVQDDGVGFNPAHNKGLGILGMAERVTGLGGRFHIESQTGRGTILSTYFPLDKNSCKPELESVS